MAIEIRREDCERRREDYRNQTYYNLVVLAVCCEPVSAQISLLNREKTGNYQGIGLHNYYARHFTKDQS